jgi:hypothetical protein
MVFLGRPDIEDPAAELRETRSLMNVLYIMKCRFSGGQFVFNVLDVVISHMFLAGNTHEDHADSNVLQDAAAIIGMGLAQGVVPSAKL